MSGEPDSSGESETESSKNEAIASVGNTPSDIAISNLNMDLLPGIRQDLEKINWYEVLATTFHIGVFIVILWSLLTTGVLFLNYLIESSSGFSLITRSLTVAPIVFPVLALFGYVARWSWRRMENTPPPSDSIIGQIKRLSVNSSSTLFVISVVSLGLALMFRTVIHTVSVDLYGPGLTPSQTISVVILDGIYIGFLLISI